MFTKTDCLSLLFELRDKGVDVDKDIKYLLVHSEPTLDIIRTINNNMELSIRAFYEKLRKSYNNNKSKLYINIVKENNLEPKEVLCTLASLQLQILLFNKTLDDPSFLRTARFNEICDCLKAYYISGDIIPSQKLLELFKADLKFLEETSK
jgi:hypothetical protein